ncbi:hypothetical protein ACXJJ3_21785 [Kribbella sp. WER1]
MRDRAGAVDLRERRGGLRARLMQGWIFQPGPRSRACRDSTPSVARAPPALAPSGFSALIE